MTSEDDQHAHDMMADLRAVSTAMADPDSGPLVNTGLAEKAWMRGPAHAVMFTAMVAVRRLDLVNLRRRDQGLPAQLFPRYQLMAALRRPTEGYLACIDLIRAFVVAPVPKSEPATRFVTDRGFVGFMNLVHVANLTGQLLVDADPELDSLAHLLQLEALADEADWERGLDT